MNQDELIATAVKHAERYVAKHCMDIPYVSIKKYSELSGETEAAVRQQVQAGDLPIKQRKKDRGRIYINIELLRKQARESKY